MGVYTDAVNIPMADMAFSVQSMCPSERASGEVIIAITTGTASINRKGGPMNQSVLARHRTRLLTTYPHMLA